MSLLVGKRYRSFFTSRYTVAFKWIFNILVVQCKLNMLSQKFPLVQKHGVLRFMTHNQTFSIYPSLTVLLKKCRSDYV